MAQPWRSVASFKKNECALLRQEDGIIKLFMINDRDRRDRMIRDLVREIGHLNQLERNLPLMKLEEPYQRGWRRLFFLTEPSLMRPDKEALELILPHINNEVVSIRPDFRRKNGKSRKMVEMKQGLRCISLLEWNRKKLPEEWKKYFRFNNKSHWMSCWHYEFTRPWIYELRIIPNWMTHVKMIDPNIRSRIDEIENYMTTHQLRNRYSWLRGVSCGRRWLAPDPRQKNLKKEIEKEIQEELDLFSYGNSQTF